MKVHVIEDELDIKSRVSQAKEVHLEMTGKYVRRIIFGPLAAPLVMFEKKNGYDDALSALAPETATKHRTSTMFKGSLLTHVADTEAELLKWEEDVRNSVPGATFDFAHTTEITYA